MPSSPFVDIDAHVHAPPAWIWQASSYEEELARGILFIWLGVMLATFHYAILRARFHPHGASHTFRAYLLLTLLIFTTYLTTAILLYAGRNPTSGVVEIRPFGIPGWAMLGVVETFVLFLVMDVISWYRVERYLDVVERMERGVGYGTMERGRGLERTKSAPAGMIWGRRVVV